MKKYREAVSAPVPPPAVVGQIAGSAAGVGISSKDNLATREQLLAKPWKHQYPKGAGTWVFNSDKTLSSSSGYKAEWSIKGRTLSLDWGKGNVTQFSLELQPSDGDLVLRGMDAAGEFNGATLTQAAK